MTATRPLPDEQAEPAELSDRDIEQLEGYKLLYHRGFTQEQRWHLRFQRWRFRDRRRLDDCPR